MLPKPENCLDALNLYLDDIRVAYPEVQAKRIENELTTGVYRYLAPAFGFKRADYSKKLTKAEVEAAREFFTTLSLESLLQVLQVLLEAFEKWQVPPASRNTYGGRVRQWIAWTELQRWYPRKRLRSGALEEDCAPSRPKKFGSPDNLKLMPDKGLPTIYRLKDTEKPPELAQALDDLFHFLSDPEHPLRLFDKIAETTAKGYIKDAELYLGWFYRYYRPQIPLDQLRLELLFPKVSEEELEQLTPKQQKQLWRKHKDWVKQWVSAYFQFLKDVQKSYSPRTRHKKLEGLFAVGRYLYADQIEEVGDYRQIPLLIALQAMLGRWSKEVKEWTTNRQYVADQSKKWPNVPEGKTALKVMQEQVVESLRRCCCPRDSVGNFHKPHVLAQLLEDFLMWADLSYQPSRRQQELRTRKISLSCPIERPASVPPDGLYHPLPPREVRDRRDDGIVNDNYLYRAYEIDGKSYPEGVWAKSIWNYKTSKHHGEYSGVIPNRQFSDGTCLYDYIEHYLYGWWLPGKSRNADTYDWWDPELKGTQGRWITKGRTEFEPEEYCCVRFTNSFDYWSWGHVFPVPATGLMYQDGTLSYAFSCAAYEWIGKRTTPHTMRYMWATWAFQVGLTDAQLRSLAEEMGTTVETLRKWYERCTPEDKRKPINEAIDVYLFGILKVAEPAQPEGQAVFQFLSHFQQLTPDQQRQIRESVLQSTSYDQ